MRVIDGGSCLQLSAASARLYVSCLITGQYWDQIMPVYGPVCVVGVFGSGPAGRLLPVSGGLPVPEKMK